MCPEVQTNPAGTRPGRREPAGRGAGPARHRTGPGTALGDPELASLPTEVACEEWQDLDVRPTGAIVELLIDEELRARDAVRRAAPAITAAVDAIVPRMLSGGRLIYVGAGSAGRMAAQDAAEVAPTFGVPSGLVVALVAGGTGALVDAREGLEDDAGAAVEDLDHIGTARVDTVVGVSASGRTPYVRAAVKHARELGAMALAVVTNVGTPLAAAVDLAVEVPTGPEVIAGSTRLKAATAQKLVLNALSTAVMVRLGRTYGNLMVDVRPENAKLRDRARRIVAQAAQVPLADAAAALAGCDGQAATAIVTLVGRVPPPVARDALARADGRVRAALQLLTHP